MVVNKHDALIKKLQKQVLLLQRREEKAKTHVKTTIKKARKLGKEYKGKLAKKVRDMKNRIADAETAAYIRAAADLKQRLLKTMQVKGKLLSTVIAKINKTQAAHLIKCFSSKGLKANKNSKRRKR